MLTKCACIYCGSTETSESDIIPDALTNARIMNKNVCKTEHNNKFSDLFESEVIEKLALITNELDIKSHKSSDYASYSAKIEIEGIEYETNMTSEKDLFNRRKILVSSDKKCKLGSLDTIKKMAKNSNLVSEVDINKIPLTKYVEINLEVYFSEKMYRMVSKIAYEWYCAKNNVIGYHNEFESIVTYITSGKGKCPVTILQNKELYDFYEKQVDLGSHGLFCFIDNEGKINVIVCLFGIAMYRVIVLNKVLEFCKNNFMYIELRTDASRKELVHSSFEDAENYFHEILLNPADYHDMGSIGEIHIVVPKEINAKKDVTLYPFVFNMMKCFLEIYDETKEPNEKIKSILINNIQEILQTSSLHKKALKRFVKEYFGDGDEDIRLNSETSNKKAVFLFYILFIIGKKGIENIDDKLLMKMTKDALGMGREDEFIITDDIEKKMQNEILYTDDYSKLLNKGAEVIRKWKD